MKRAEILALWTAFLIVINRPKFLYNTTLTRHKVIIMLMVVGIAAVTSRIVGLAYLALSMDIMFGGSIREAMENAETQVGRELPPNPTDADASSTVTETSSEPAEQAESAIARAQDPATTENAAIPASLGGSPAANKAAPMTKQQFLNKHCNANSALVDADGNYMCIGDIKKKFPELRFANEMCDPCNKSCEFTMSDRTSGEELMRAVDSNTPQLPSIPGN